MLEGFREEFLCINRDKGGRHLINYRRVMTYRFLGLRGCEGRSWEHL